MSAKSSDDALTAADARALLSEHIDGTLQDPTRVQLDALLAADPALRQERDQLAQTVAALRALPRPEASTDMVARVRARLTEERRGQQASASSGTQVPPQRFRWGGVEVAVGLAAAAGVALFVVLVGMPGQHGGAPGGTLAAGVSDEGTLSQATLVALGVPDGVVMDLAANAGLDTLQKDGAQLVFSGDKRAAARFVLMLKSDAVARGIEVSGLVPEADRVQLIVKTR